MKFKILLITGIALLLNGGFVDSQSIKGLLIPNAHQRSVVVPQKRAIQQVVNNKDSFTFSKSYTLPKGYLLPKKGQNSTFMPQTINKMQTEVNNTVINNNNSSSNNSNNNSNATHTIDQSKNDLISLDNNVQSQTGETVDTTGFSRIQTLVTTPVPAHVSTGMEEVDTERLLILRNNPTLSIQSSSHSVETVDTAGILNKNNNPPVYLSNHLNAAAESVDTATFLARLKPVINEDSLNLILNKPKPNYKSQTLSGTFLPEKGKNNMMKPLEIDTTTYLAPLPVVVKDNFNFPGTDNFPSNKSKGIGQLDDLLPTDTVKPVVIVSTQLGELAELPENLNTGNNSGTGNESPKVKVDDFYKFNDGTIFYDTSKVLTVSRGRSFAGSLISKPGKSAVLQPTTINPDDVPTITPPVPDDFYKFNDGTIFYDTSKVLTNSRGRSFAGSLISKPGKSAVLQPTINPNDVPTITPPKLDDSKSDVLPSTVDVANNNNSNEGKINNDKTTDFAKTDELKVTFYINQSGKVIICFSCNAYYINITQWGYISDYVFKSVSKKDKANKTVHKNALGLVDNIGGSPIEYTDDHLITQIGTWPVKYTFDNMIESVGDYKVYYNSASNVKKIDKYKVSYDINKTVLSIEDSGGLIILKPEEMKKL